MSIGSDLRTARDLREQAEAITHLTTRVNELSQKIAEFTEQLEKTPQNPHPEVGS